MMALSVDLCKVACNWSGRHGKGRPHASCSNMLHVQRRAADMLTLTKRSAHRCAHPAERTSIIGIVRRVTEDEEAHSRRTLAQLPPQSDSQEQACWMAEGSGAGVGAASPPPLALSPKHGAVRGLAVGRSVAST